MSPVPGIVSSTQQVLKIWWTKNKDEFCFPALGHPSVISLSASIPRLECVPPGSDFSTSSRVAGGCALWFVYLGLPAQGRRQRNPQLGRVAQLRGTSLPPHVSCVFNPGRNRA